MESQFLLQTRFVFFMEPTLSKTPCWYFWYFENYLYIKVHVGSQTNRQRKELFRHDGPWRSSPPRSNARKGRKFKEIPIVLYVDFLLVVFAGITWFFKINMNILLLFQALFFYLPHFMWSIMEMDLMKSFSYQMKDPESDDVNRMKRTERCQKSKIILI